jgi:hypothetical protein
MRLPRLAYNMISGVGAVIASVTAIIILFMLGISFFTQMTNPYLGIFIYMILPPFLILGLILIPLGMLREWHRVQRGETPSEIKWPYIDLNKKSHRNAFLIFIIGTIIFMVGGAVLSYQAFHFTESVTFCGTTCHNVMQPEYTAYQNSPHARVACTECHVGSGAGWYTKSKLSGMYQVYAVLTKVFPRPIPTPVKNLRPAQETCEQCHWPRQFYGAQQRQFNHYKYDSTNTSWPINMLIKTGGGDPKTGQTAGIHWHMNICFKVEYIARDERRQDIPWVRVTNRQTGKATTYQDQSNPLPADSLGAYKPRVMDCMDCHNRPSHIYHAPDNAIDVSMLIGRIDPDIPDIKKVAVGAMAAEYSTYDSAMTGISSTIADYYKQNRPEIYESMRSNIDDAIKGTQASYSMNIFPFMKARWSAYPNNIGHFYSVGCMRCHLGNHKSDDGKTLTHDCTACHTILGQGAASGELSTAEKGLEFQHPEDIGDTWKETGCYECHSGVQP